MYITSHYYSSKLNNFGKIPRQRFINYYRDLFSIEGVKCSRLKASHKKNAYNFSELGNTVLSVCCARGDLIDCDLFAVAYWGHEYDPEHSFGAYFCHRYSITGKTFDVCEQGVLAPLTAMYLIQCYMQHGSVKKAALLCMDQSTIPLHDDFIGIKPHFASARIIFFHSEYQHHAFYKILSINFYQNFNKQRMEIEKDNQKSCPEIFYPMFEGRKKKHLKEIVRISAINVEGDSIGILCAEDIFY